MRYRSLAVISQRLSDSEEYIVLGAAILSFGMIVLLNPRVVALPLGGTVAVIGMVWSIDRLHYFFENKRQAVEQFHQTHTPTSREASLDEDIIQSESEDRSNLCCAD